MDGRTDGRTGGSPRGKFRSCPSTLHLAPSQGVLPTSHPSVNASTPAITPVPPPQGGRLAGGISVTGVGAAARGSSPGGGSGGGSGAGHGATTRQVRICTRGFSSGVLHAAFCTGVLRCGFCISHLERCIGRFAAGCCTGGGRGGVCVWGGVAFGIWDVAFGVWQLVLGILHFASSVLHLANSGGTRRGGSQIAGVPISSTTCWGDVCAFSKNRGAGGASGILPQSAKIPFQGPLKDRRAMESLRCVRVLRRLRRPVKEPNAATPSAEPREKKNHPHPKSKIAGGSQRRRESPHRSGARLSCGAELSQLWLWGKAPEKPSGTLPKVKSEKPRVPPGRSGTARGGVVWAGARSRRSRGAFRCRNR